MVDRLGVSAVVLCLTCEGLSRLLGEGDGLDGYTSNALSVG